MSGIEEETRTRLINSATEAKQNAYAPYSKFRVGAALLTQDGKIYKGCNVENSSYGLCICAERTALVKAVSDGHLAFKAIAVTTDIADSFCSPCGACRQFLVEFGLDIEVVLARPDGAFQLTTSGALLPSAFTPKDLGLKRI